jgi:TRAP-type C4-dicarboxylate transport system substrate-binding protein
VSKAIFDKLTPGDRTALRQAASEARDFERNISREKNRQALEKLTKTMRVAELGPVEEAKMREAVKPVIDKYTKIVGERLVGDFGTELAKVRSKKTN